MSTEAKTRIYATVDGKDHEIFSVRETKDGQLRILLRGSRAKHEKNVLRVYKDKHFSIHKTSDGNNTCITCKSEYVDGHKEDLVAFIHETSEKLLWPVFFMRQGFDGSSIFPKKPKDNVICIGRYESHFATMYLSAFVMLSSMGSLNIEADCFKCKVLKFKYYQLILLISFIDIPTLTVNFETFRSTSSVVYDKKRGDDHKQVKLFSYTGQQMLEQHINECRIMRDDQMLSYNYISDDQKALVNFCRETLKGGGLKASPSVQIK